MNREIKFRAFVEIDGEKKMRQVDELVLDGGQAVFYSKDLETSCHFDLNKIHLLQYTGLKDKNGKDIYEGNVVKRYCDIEKKTYRGVVKYEDAGFIIETIGKHEYAFYDYMGSKFSWDELEIIGNIYENHELLKETK